jgi:D-aspartate ligase
MTAPPLFLLGGGLEPHRGPVRRGIGVFVAGGGGHMAPLRYSRRLRFVADAPESWSADYEPWLRKVLRSKPAAVVLPTNDDHAWRLSRIAGDRHFGRNPIAVGDFDAVRAASVKSRITTAAASVGLATPRTQVLRDGSDLTDATNLRFPLMLKPQMRIGMKHWTRGRLLRNTGELREAFDWYRNEVAFEPAVLADAPEAAFPLAQEYIVRPGREVRHITGYLARSGESAVRSHRKLLQEPLRFGSGVCFETTPVDEDLAARLLGLLRHIGYHGIFEAEFLQHGGEHLLIDLNVRPYNGLSLTLASGLDLVTCSYLEASGQLAALSFELEAARLTPFRSVAWCNHLALMTLLPGQLLSGGLGPGEARRHLSWAWRNRGRTVNPAVTRDDPRLAVAHLARHVLSPFVSPREFLGRYVRSGLDR